MPVFEQICEQGHRFEWYASTADKPDPSCRSCGGATQRLISTFAAPFTGSIGRFNDPKKEYAKKTEEGHWVWRKRSTRRADGLPEREFIQTAAQQNRYCRDEGLMNPGDINPNAQVSKDGMTVATTGMGGTWV